MKWGMFDHREGEALISVDVAPATIIDGEGFFSAEHEFGGNCKCKPKLIDLIVCPMWVHEEEETAGTIQ